MLDAIRARFAESDWQGLLEQVSNDRIVAFFTSPWGLGVLGAILILSVFLKWRMVFVVVSAGIAIGFLARSTLSGEITGPSRSLFGFAAGGVVIGAFIIYYVFIRED